MNHRIVRPAAWLPATLAAAALAAAGVSVQAQDATGIGAAGAASSGGGIGSGAMPAAGASPYYLGASQGFTHTSNVYQVPSGPGDTYSSTTLLGGFDQQISRQRVYGNADVSLNRYNSQTQLNNTSYDLRTGLDWQTIHRLSGHLDLGLSQSLAAPGISSEQPDAVRNVGRTESVNGRIRWGGQALVTLEAAAGYRKLDYSSPAYVFSNSRETTTSLAAYYQRSDLLRLGVAARFVDTRAPQAFFDPTSSTYEPNTSRSRNLDLLANYALSGLLNANARLSYTRQTDSTVDGASFSGITGSVGLAWQATGKTSVQLSLARDAGFDANRFTTYGTVQDSSGAIQFVPSIGQYENSRLSDSATLGLNYLATAKINAYAGASYVRAHLDSIVVNDSGNATGPESIDSLRTAFIGADYAFARNWSLACKLDHQNRRLSGGIAYSYDVNTVGCSARYQLIL